MAENYFGAPTAKTGVPLATNGLQSLGRSGLGWNELYADEEKNIVSDLTKGIREGQQIGKDIEEVRKRKNENFALEQGLKGEIVAKNEENWLKAQEANRLERISRKRSASAEDVGTLMGQTDKSKASKDASISSLEERGASIAAKKEGAPGVVSNAIVAGYEKPVIENIETENKAALYGADADFRKATSEAQRLANSVTQKDLEYFVTSGLSPQLAKEYGSSDAGRYALAKARDPQTGKIDQTKLAQASADYAFIIHGARMTASNAENAKTTGMTATRHQAEADFSQGLAAGASRTERLLKEASKRADKNGELTFNANELSALVNNNPKDGAEVAKRLGLGVSSSGGFVQSFTGAFKVDVGQLDNAVSYLRSRVEQHSLDSAKAQDNADVAHLYSASFAENTRSGPDASTHASRLEQVYGNLKTLDPHLARAFASFPGAFAKMDADPAVVRSQKASLAKEFFKMEKQRNPKVTDEELTLKLSRLDEALAPL